MIDDHSATATWIANVATACLGLLWLYLLVELAHMKGPDKRHTRTTQVVAGLLLTVVFAIIWLVIRAIYNFGAC